MFNSAGCDMTTITLNKVPLEMAQNSNLTLNDYIDVLLEKHLKNHDVITGIRVDGKLLSLEEENKCLPHVITNFESVDFQIQSTLELAFEALDSCSAYIDAVTLRVRELTDLYSQNLFEDANLKFGDVIDIMDLFVQLMGKINKTLKTNLPDSYTKSNTIQNLEIHLLSVLRSLVPAKEKNDIIMLCDLLEYELIDNLTQWKIKAIPELKSLRKI
jgi:hypothetical protein